ncbi:hypothetical protein MIND_00064900 [Mycena indigotica]|uniref:Uncharacterized protein n=1 Tax=Mycena indigotica TaxID=2126181 RepID=A0A8H6WG62_9AGAR|nr:uncharacterized protein MIND_00064900 [Mycena indigotica]KAF7315496.1 hypothetical protein MIND_00064900 [Mycena indigotica]
MDLLAPEIQTSVEDQYASRKLELETAIKELLGEAYIVDVDLCAVWPYAERNGGSNFGATITGYFEGFIAALKRYVRIYGEPGKLCFNRVVTERTIELKVNPLGEEYSSAISASITHGVYAILFHPRWFGTPMCVPPRDHGFEVIRREVDRLQVPMNLLGHSFTLVAQHSVEKLFDSESARLQTGFSRLLGVPVVLDPNWGEVYAALQATRRSHDSDNGLGQYAFRCFEDLYDRLEILPELRDPATQQQIRSRLSESTFTIRLQVLLQKESDIDLVVVQSGVALIQFTPSLFLHGDGYRDKGAWLLKDILQLE